MKWISLTILIGVTSYINCINYLSLTENYFNESSTNLGSVFVCLNRREQHDLAKTLMSKRQLISVLNLKRPEVFKNLKTNHYHIGIVLDGNCPESEHFLIQCGQQNFFDVKHHWLIVSSSLEDMKEKFKNVTLNIDADIQIAIPDQDNKNWTIVDIYNPASRHGGTLNTTTVGFYSTTQGYQARNQVAQYWRRKNMTGVTFKSLVVLPAAFKGSLNDYLYNDDDRDVNTFNRFHSRLVLFCKDYYNFSMEIAVTPSWGYTNPDGTFDGMVGALERGEIDFGSSPLFVRADRAKVIDYGRNTWILRAAFIFRNPKAKTSFEVFLHPLSTSIWIFTILLASIAVVLFKIATTFEKKKYRYSDETSWSLSALFTLGAFCQQGAPSTPRLTCGRITTVSIFLLSVIIYQFYSASLVSNLLSKPSTTIKTLKDLLESPLQAGCEEILYDRDYFQHTNDEVALELYHKKILGKGNISNFLSPEEGLVLVEKGGYAFHVETATAYPIIEATFHEKPICELREIQLFRTQPMHANYQKHSPFRDMMDTCLQRIAEHGMLFRERKHWHPRKPECIQSSESITFNVGLDEFYPALIGLVIGIIASLTILIIEKQVKVFSDNAERQAPLTVKEKAVLPFIE